MLQEEGEEGGAAVGEAVIDESTSNLGSYLGSTVVALANQNARARIVPRSSTLRRRAAAEHNYILWMALYLLRSRLLC